MGSRSRKATGSKGSKTAKQTSSVGYTWKCPCGASFKSIAEGSLHSRQCAAKKKAEQAARDRARGNN
jgi:hypothetical protein